MIVDVNRNGSSIFTTQANRPKLNIGAMASGVVTPDVRSGIAGDRLTFDVDQVDVAGGLRSGLHRCGDIRAGRGDHEP